MTVQQGAAEADVKIRTATREWILLAGAGCIAFASAAFSSARDLPVVTLPLLMGCVFVAEALWTRSFGVDLTQESANIRGVRRRSIPWHQVQAVLREDQFGSARVSLILESGKRVLLRAPTTWWGVGDAGYERDFHRIGQWWLAHRGESWRPVRPEAPWPPAQE
jgi:hypothetical protein